MSAVALRRSVVAFAVTALLASCSEPIVPPADQPPAIGAPRFDLSPTFDPYEFLGFVPDDNGANDTPAQSDLNAFTRADNVTGFIAVKWVWDDVNAWTGSGQTGDACALFDTDEDTKANAAVCVRISNPNGDPNVIAQLASPASPLVYSCGDSKADRCGQPTTLKPLAGTVCEVEKIDGETFFEAGEDGADVLAACSIPLAAITTDPEEFPNLLNVCSFPSGSPNSNPFDCVVTPGAGFLIIKKATDPQESDETFSFTISPALVSGSSASLTDDTDQDEQTGLLSAVKGTNYSVTEGTLPAGWQLDDASCVRQTSPDPTPTGSKDGNTVSSIEITSGETTVCTFTNSMAAPSISVTKTPNPDEVPETGGSVTYTVVVTNNSTIAVTLTSLVDDQFGVLKDITGTTCNGTGNLYGSIAANGGTYSCTFPATLAADDAGEEHVNEVTASGTSAAGNVEAKATATVTYTDVLPEITVTKEANIEEIEAEGGASVDNFFPDQTFERGAGGSGGSTPIFAGDTCDDGGPNDQGSDQSDLNCFSRADNVSGRLWLRWTWDEKDAWTGGGQTGDACALLDTDNNSRANYAFCARVANPDGGSISLVARILYKCKDVANSGAIDRCASKTQEQALDVTSVCTVGFVDEHFTSPPFAQAGDDAGDTKAECNLKLSDLGNFADIDLLNVCSFPSGSPNSNPFDCVITPAAGFLVINKLTTPTNSDAFFAYTLLNEAGTANATSTLGHDQFAVQGGAITSTIPLLPGTYRILEQMPDGWSLGTNGISCIRDNASIGSTSGTTQLGVTIVQGQTTECTFDNSLSGSQLVTFTVTVTNNKLEDVRLFSLEDTEDPDAQSPTYATLHDVGTCATGGTIVNGTPYTCTFTRTISGPVGTVHKNKVKAVGQDDDGNSDTKESTIVTVTIIEATP